MGPKRITTWSRFIESRLVQDYSIDELTQIFLFSLFKVCRVSHETRRTSLLVE